MDKRVFFLTGEWTALKRFVRGEVCEPEGMPSVYLPWLRYKDRGYGVHVFMIGSFEDSSTIDFMGCSIHLVARPRLFAWRNRQKRFRCRFPADCYFLYKAAVAVGKNGPPDVVYSLQPWLSYTAWALGRKYRSVNVKRIYGTWLYHDWFLSNSLRKKLMCLPHFLAWKVPSDMTIISEDGTGGDRLTHRLRIDSGKYRMWLNGIDKDSSENNTESQALRRKIGLNEDDFVLLCLSRLARWKRQDRVIEAMPEILRHLPNARLVIAGDGPMRRELESLADSLGLSSYVHFTGIISHAQVRTMLSIADIFLQTNDLSCLGNTLLEALACGKTIVTWDVGGTKNVMTDGVNGRMLADAEPSSVAGAVIELASDPKKRASLAQGAREFAQEHLSSWDQRLDKEIDLIESLKVNSRDCFEAEIVRRMDSKKQI